MHEILYIGEGEEGFLRCEVWPQPCHNTSTPPKDDVYVLLVQILPYQYNTIDIMRICNGLTIQKKDNSRMTTYKINFGVNTNFGFKLFQLNLI